MAEYIDDSGAYGRDALLAGTKGTEYDYNTTNKTLTMETGGSADSDFILPDSPWVVFEVYNVADGGNKVLGKQKWTSSVGVIATTLSDYMTAIRLIYTGNFDIVATHYKGNDLADRYDGDESTDFPTTPDFEDGAYTGHGSKWIVSDSLLADEIVTEFTVHISFNKVTDPAGNDPENDVGTYIAYPAGVYGNDFLLDDAGGATEYSLVDSLDNTTELKLRMPDTWQFTAANTISATEVDALSRHQMVNKWSSTGSGHEMNIYLPIGTYDIKISAAAGDGYDVEYVFNSNITETLTIVAPQPNSADIDAFAVSTAGWFDLVVNVSTGTYSRIAGIDITKTA